MLHCIIQYHHIQLFYVALKLPDSSYTLLADSNRHVREGAVNLHCLVSYCSNRRLFIRQDKTAVQDMRDGVKSRITEAGYSVSVGYAIRNDRDDTVTEMLRKSDEKMYEDKAEHYRQNGNDRRGK